MIFQKVVSGPMYYSCTKELFLLSNTYLQVQMGIIAVVMVFRIKFGLNEHSCTKLKESIL